jgi:hypothetical protein
MTFDFSYSFTQNIEQLSDIYRNIDFRKAILASLGSTNIDIQITENEEVTTIKIIREVPINAPRALKKFIPVQNKMLQTEVWRPTENGYQCQMSIEIPNAPLTIKSVIELRRTKTGSVTDSKTSIKARIPFLGSVLEKFLVATSKKSILAECEYIAQNAETFQ